MASWTMEDVARVKLRHGAAVPARKSRPQSGAPLERDIQRAISFVVPGEPIPKARPRVVDGHAYTPQRTQDAEESVAVAAMAAGVRSVAGEVELEIVAYRRTARRCDVDNLAKTVLDGLIGVAFADDSQIVRLEVRKRIDRERPRTEVTVRSW